METEETTVTEESPYVAQLKEGLIRGAAIAFASVVVTSATKAVIKVVATKLAERKLNDSTEPEA